MAEHISEPLGGDGAVRAAPADESVTTLSLAAELPDEAELWAADEWMRAWLESEPLLGQMDLGPYFYFARDRLSGLITATGRMSPLARDVLAQLLSPSKAVRDAAATRTKNVIAPDAVAILEALAERVRASRSTEEASLPFQGMLALVGVRQELATEFISVLRSLPYTLIAAGTPNRLQLLLKSVPSTREGIRSLLTEWRVQSDNPELAGAARLALQSGE
jgi:hypothetical protein